MIIIIEGTDGAGKTTLANKLAESTGFTYLHRSKPKDEEERKQALMDYGDMCHNARNIIVDRCWYSEMVYGKVMQDRGDIIGVSEMWYFEKAIMANSGGVIVHCTDHVNELWERATERGETYITSFDKLDQLKNEYEHLFHHVYHYIPIVRYELSKNLPWL